MSDQHDAPTDAVAPPPTGASTIRGVRRIAVVAIIASMSITAIVGIVALLGGDFGQSQIQNILTTLLISGFSVVTLCHLAVAGRPVRIVGFAGIGVSVVALALGLALIWAVWGDGTSTVLELLRWFGASGILALSLAQANLLLLLAGRRHPVVRVALAATLVTITVVAVMLIVPILTEYVIPGANADAYWRWFGVVAILDALGTVVLPVVALFVRDGSSDATDASSAGPDAATTLAAVAGSPALEQRIAAVGAATGLDRETLLGVALDAFEAARRGTDRT